MNSQPSLSLVIPTHQRASSLLRLLSSLSHQTRNVGVKIVFNQPDDPGIDAVRSWLSSSVLDVEILVSGQKGANAARNFGLSHVQTDWVYFLDDDCWLTNQNHIQRLMVIINNSLGVCALGGGYLSSSAETATSRFYNDICNGWLMRSHLGDGRVGNLLGGNVCYQTKFLRDHQLTFDPNIIYGGTETEFHGRLAELGGRMHLNRDLDVYHEGPHNLMALAKKAYAQGINKGRTHSQTGDIGGIATSVVTSAGPGQGSQLLIKIVYHWAFHYGVRSIHGVVEERSALSHFFDFGRSGLVFLKSRRLRKQQDQTVLEAPFWSGYFVGHSSQSVHEAFQLLKTYPLSKAFVPIAQWREWQTQSKGLQIESVPVVQDNDVDIDQALTTQASSVLMWVDSTARQSSVRVEKLLNGFSECFFLQDISERRVRRKSLSIYSNKALAKWSFFVRRKRTRDGNWYPSSHQIFLWLDGCSKKLASRNAFVRLAGPPGFLNADSAIDDNYIFYPHANDLSSSLHQVVDHTESPKLSVVIASLNGEDQLEHVLSHLNLQQSDTGPFEVIVIDDGSNQPLLDLVLQWRESQSSVKFSLRVGRWERLTRDGRKDSRFRAGKSRNWGAALARSEHLCFLDSDILVQSDFIATVIRQMRPNLVLQSKRFMLSRHVQVGAPDFSLNKIAIEKDCYSEDLYWENFKSAQSWSDLPKPWKYTCTYAMALNKQDFWKVGGFDPNFSEYGFEDVDLGYRLGLLGSGFEFLDSAVFHQYPRDVSHNHHFDMNRRYQTLYETCTTFYFRHLDPNIFKEFSSLMLPPSFFLSDLKGNLSDWYYFWEDKYYKTRSVLFLMIPLYRHSKWACKVLIHLFMKYLILIGLKPYFFVRFQWHKTAFTSRSVRLKNRRRSHES